MTFEACREIIEDLLEHGDLDSEDVNLIKARIAEKYGLTSVPSNSEIMKCAEDNEKPKILKILRRKAVRTASGVTIVAVMTKPWPCPQGEPCAYCPGGPSHGVPQAIPA